MLSYSIDQNKKGFDLYFAAGSSGSAEEEFNALGCNRLFSWIEKSNIKRWSKINTNPECKLFIDSGAYSAYTKGIEIDLDEYIQFLNDNDDRITVCADLDTITLQPRTHQDFIQADINSQHTWDNYLYMIKRVKSPHKILPVFHQWEKWKWLHNMLEYVDESGNHVPYIGLSPKLDSSEDKCIFLKECFNIIKNSSNPNVKTHAFGMTTLSVLERFPLTSADSTTWVLVAAYGGIITDAGVVLVSSVQKGNPKHLLNLPEQAKDLVLKHLTKYNVELEEVMEDYKARCLVNIRYLKDWADNYKYRPQVVSKKKLF